jgi:CDP-6-deoxy-D-xylo-4-hexulose-3-dehydrase
MTKFRPGIDRIEYGGAMIGQEEKDAINKVIDDMGGRRWTIGPESEAFEKELAKTTGVKRAVVVNSGSSALLLALASLHLPKGTKVIIPAVNFPTAFNAIIQNNLVPLVVDVDPETLNLSLKEVETAVTIFDDVGAVIAVDIAGNPVDLIKLREIMGDRFIILDNCDGYGTKLHGKFIDAYADLSCASFHAAHIITTGEGGAVFTDNTELADRVRKLREWGRVSGTDKIYSYPGFPDDYRERYVYEEIGYNMKPLELQCAMGRVQLKRLTDFREARARNFDYYKEVFKFMPKFQTMEYIKDSEPCWFSFPFMTRVIKRKYVMDCLEAHNIECRTIFSGNITRHPAYKNTEYVSTGSHFNADDVMHNGIFISVHPSITIEMLEYVAMILKEIHG